MVERYSELTSTDVADTRLITLQLGNGCSAAAVFGGKSLDTSMGFTPLEGLMMGTRSGYLDPSLASYLAQREEVDIQSVENSLNRESGQFNRLCSPCLVAPPHPRYNDPTG